MAEKVKDCTNCSGRGYHETKVKVYDPDKGVYVEVESRETCGVCQGDGFIIEGE